MKGIKNFKFKITLFTIFMLAISLSFYGCAKKPSVSPKVLATVNGKSITVSEFKTELAKLPPSVISFVSTPAGAKKFLKNLVERDVLADQAKKDGINKSKQYKMQVSDFKKSILVQLLLNKVIQKKLIVTESEAKAFYTKHSNIFNHPSKINASYIQTDSLPAAKKVYASLQKNVPFSKLVKEYSTASNAKSGGNLGWIKFGQTSPAFNEAAFSISKIGGYSNIVRVGKYFDIIRLNKIISGKPKPFSQIKNQLMAILKERKGRKLFKDYITKVNKQAKISYYYNNLPSSPSSIKAPNNVTPQLKKSPPIKK
jgi:peptidyl-prolyl cis-trans isomerase C